jgi:hypothetical protein
MSKQFGPVHLSGQYGDIRMVVDRGKGRAHMSRTVTKEQIMTLDSFQATRENMSEFGGSGNVARAIRMCLTEASHGFGERFLGARLNGLARRVISRGAGIGGERSFTLAPSAGLFRKFDLNREELFGDRFKAAYTVTVNADRNTATLDVPVLDTRADLRKPAGTTHFRVFLTVGLLSDFVYSATDKRYEAVDAVLNGKGAAVSTPVLPWRGPGTPTFLQLVAQVPGLPVPPAGVTLVVGMGVEFIRQIGGANTVLGSGNAMKIDSVYT